MSVNAGNAIAADCLMSTTYSVLYNGLMQPVCCFVPVSQMLFVRNLARHLTVGYSLRGNAPFHIDKNSNPDTEADGFSMDREHDDETNEKIKDREFREKTPTQTEKSLTQRERNDVADHGRLSALSVYSIILREGEGELERPITSLWWSGVAAGIGISTSVLSEGILRSGLGEGFPYLSLVESFGYTFGFVLVIICGLQLFTENTITVVLPVLADPALDRIYRTARLWGIVFVSNMFGTFFTAAIAVYGGILTDEILASILEISRHLAELPPSTTLLRGIPAGFFIAALVWMLPSVKGSGVLVIILFTWLIAAGEFTHVVAGSNEIFTLVLTGEMNIVLAFTNHIFPMLIGNILGGTGLFALLAYGQVSQEI